MRRVVVTGLGLVTPLGVGVKQSWRALIAGESGIRSVRAEDARYESIPSRIAGTVPTGPAEDAKWNAKDWFDAREMGRMARFAQYAVVAADEALQDAGWRPHLAKDLEDTAVCVGSGIGGFEDVYNTSVDFSAAGYRAVSPMFIPRLLINLAAGHISIRHNFKGPNISPTTACTTGAHAISEGARLIRTGAAKVVVAGASEACIHPLVLAGFARTRSLATRWNDAPELASRPFDRDRAGFVIGEGAGVVILEEIEHALSRRRRSPAGPADGDDDAVTIYAELAGAGLSGDAHHITAPSPDGEGAYSAMTRALDDAGMRASDVDYINAHATSTLLGDRAECCAIRRLMAGRQSALAVSSTKGATGHLLGAAGAVEAVFTVKTIQQGVVPPTLNLEHPDDGVENFNLNLVPKKLQKKTVDLALSNSFGFGGTNASLCFSRFDASTS